MIRKMAMRSDEMNDETTYGWINVRLRMDKLPFEWKNACLWVDKLQFMGG